MKVLIIGLGSIGKKHVNAIKTIQPDTEIVALRSSKEVENIEGITNIFSIAGINGVTFDFAIISNPTSEHKKTISQLLAYNIPLFIEKPLYLSLKIDLLIDTINRRGIFTYVACNLRFLESILFVKEQLNRFNYKRLNEVNVYCGSYLPNWRPDVDFKKTYSAIPELGGGVHIDLIHELDYIYWLFGFPHKVTKTFKNQSSLDIRSFDYANYLLEYKGFCANIILNYYRRESKRSLELIFDDETWIVDLLMNQVTCNGRIIYSSEQRIIDTYSIQMKYFIDCMMNNEKSMNTVNEAYNVLKICLDQ